jgi:superfamily I DNA/RNA helicase
MKRIKIPGPPGTGKTYRLINHYLNIELNEKKTLDQNILYVGFSNAAVDEARKRILNLYPGHNIQVSTLHSLGKRTLNLDSNLLLKGKTWQPFADRFGHNNLKFDSTPSETGYYTYEDKYLKVIEYAKNKLLGREEVGHAAEELGVLDDIDVPLCKQIYQDLEDYKRDERMYEFSDMIKKFIEEGCTLSLDAVFLDEAQDLNPLQWKMFYQIESLCDRSYIAGDDDQTIYSFQGASAKEFINLEGEIDPQIISNRVPRAIHKLAVSVLDNIENRLPKQWDPRDEEGEVIDNKDLYDIDFSKKDWMILVRRKNQLPDIVEHLENNGFYFDCVYGKLLTPSLLRAWRVWDLLNQGEGVEGREARQLYEECFQVKTKQVKHGFAGGLTLNGLEFVTLKELKINHGLLIEGDWKQLNMSDEQREYIQGLLDSKEDLHKNPRIKVSTIHKVKGEECENVILFTDISWFIYSQCTKTSDLKDTEHRVWFVAITRAKNNLFLMSKDPNKQQYNIGEDII